jgi:hypothetical protein
MTKKHTMCAEFNAENRNANITPFRRQCSFCKKNGHNISTCNDVRLVEFEQLCISMKTRLGITGLRRWLLDYALEMPSIVKAYAIRHCGCNLRSFIFVCVSNIVERIDNLNVTVRTTRINGINQIYRILENNLLEQLNQYIERDTTENINSHNSESRRDLIDILETFSNFINNAYEETMINRKFVIQTKIVECVIEDECECGICYDSKPKSSFVKLNCGHELCKVCIKQSLKNVRTEKPQCAFCRAEIQNMELTTQDFLDEINDLIIPTTFANAETN